MPRELSREEFLDKYERQLFNSRGYSWSEIPRIANVNGVYLITHGNDIVYIGESKDILNRFRKNHATGRNSAFRKNLAELDDLPDNYLFECEIRYVALPYGRKELEEHLTEIYNPICVKANKRK